MPRLLSGYKPLKGNYIGEAYGLLRSGLYPPYGRGAVRLFNVPESILNSWRTELENCTICINGTPVQHGTSKIFDDGSLYTYRCRSLSRWVNPITGEIEGSPHCTCDSCF